MSHTVREAERLDRGVVHQSVRVRLNGKKLGTLIGSAFRVVVPHSRFRDTSGPEVRVSDLMANRIAALDRRGAFWKKFHDANMPARLREDRGEDDPFTAARWVTRLSALVRPVTLTPVGLDGSP